MAKREEGQEAAKFDFTSTGEVPERIGNPNMIIPPWPRGDYH